MKLTSTGFVLLLVVLTGCNKETAPSIAEAPAGQTVEGKDTKAQAAAITPGPAIVSAGTSLTVRTTSTLSTKAAKSGETFTATLERPLRVGDRVVAPKGATVEGRIVDSDPGGRVKGRASIAVQLTSLEAGGGARRIATNTIRREARATKKKDAAKIGIGAGIGAAIGAIAGGGSGAAMGAAAGGGAGTGVVLATRGDPAVIPAESVLIFELTSAVTVP